MSAINGILIERTCGRDIRRGLIAIGKVGDDIEDKFGRKIVISIKVS